MQTPADAESIVKDEAGRFTRMPVGETGRGLKVSVAGELPIKAWLGMKQDGQNTGKSKHDGVGARLGRDQVIKRNNLGQRLGLQFSGVVAGW